MLGKSFFHNCCSWRHRFRILNLHKDAGISTTSVNSLALKVELDNTMDQKLASNELKVKSVNKHLNLNDNYMDNFYIVASQAFWSQQIDY